MTNRLTLAIIAVITLSLGTAVAGPRHKHGSKHRHKSKHESKRKSKHEHKARHKAKHKAKHEHKARHSSKHKARHKHRARHERRSRYRSLSRLGGSNPTNIAIVDTDLMRVAGVDRFHSQAAALSIQVREAHAIATGRNVVVAVLDGGFWTGHPLLAGRVTDHGYDAIDHDHDVNDFGNGIDDNLDGIPDQTVGHGTFVAGMVLLAAPDATILPIRVKDDEGYGTNAELIRGILYAVKAGADVINLSVEAGTRIDGSLIDALSLANAAGIVIVASAGNHSSARLGKLAANTWTLPVGAVDDNDRIAGFSATLASIDDAVFAPGVDLYGPLGLAQMGFWSGTSFSTGLVSGAAALAREVWSRATPGEIQARIAMTADPAYDQWGRELVGGRINLARLVGR